MGISNLIPVLTSTLWRIGGWKYKPARRVILPLFVAFLYHFSIWGCISALLLFGATTIPYGDGIRLKLGRWFRFYTFFVGYSYGISIFPVTHNLYEPLIISFIFGGLMWLSNKYNWFKWWFVEVIIGFYLGILLKG